jgi:cyclophilin family peptidyl-prolyl cis-trans isomerase
MKKTIGTFLTLMIVVTVLANAQVNSGAAEIKFLIKTSMGDIKVKLYNDTPLHQANFLKLVNSGWYNSSIFHRVIKGFMIQGGGKFNPKDSTYAEDPGNTVPAEILSNHFHIKGALAAARTPDNVNPSKASSGCQFYIVQGKKFTDAELDETQKRTGHIFTNEEREAYKNIGGTPHLDGSYTVFGVVYEGLEVVDKIAAVATGAANKPIKNVTFSISQIK